MPKETQPKPSGNLEPLISPDNQLINRIQQQAEKVIALFDPKKTDPALSLQEKTMIAFDSDYMRGIYPYNNYYVAPVIKVFENELAKPENTEYRNEFHRQFHREIGKIRKIKPNLFKFSLYDIVVLEDEGIMYPEECGRFALALDRGTLDLPEPKESVIVDNKPISSNLGNRTQTEEKPPFMEVKKLVEEKKPETIVIVDRDRTMIERARKLLGRDFLGLEAIRKLEDKLKKVGVNVEFPLDYIPLFPYTEEDLQAAKKFGEMLVLRPEKMLRDGREIPLTLIEIINLFHKDPLGNKQILVYTHSRYRDEWYRSENFATEPGEIKLGWSLVKKNIIDCSRYRFRHDQKQIFLEYEENLKKMGAKNNSIHRRNATEVVYDELFYYVNTGKRLLPEKYEFVQTRASHDSHVFVGRFDSLGVRLNQGFPSNPYSIIPKYSSSDLGVCPCR